MQITFSSALIFLCFRLQNLMSWQNSLWRLDKEQADINSNYGPDFIFFDYCRKCVFHCCFEYNAIIGSMYSLWGWLSSGFLHTWWRYGEAFPWDGRALKCGFFFTEHLYPCSDGVGKDTKWYQWFCLLRKTVGIRNEWNFLVCLVSVENSIPEV